MKKNVGTADAYMRIMCGLTGVAWGTAKMVKYPYRGLPVAVTAMSAMKVAEGITRFCPMLAMLKMNTEQVLPSQGQEGGTQKPPQEMTQEDQHGGFSDMGIRE